MKRFLLCCSIVSAALLAGTTTTASAAPARPVDQYRVTVSDGSRTTSTTSVGSVPMAFVPFGTHSASGCTDVWVGIDYQPGLILHSLAWTYNIKVHYCWHNFDYLDTIRVGRPYFTNVALFYFPHIASDDVKQYYYQVIGAGTTSGPRSGYYIHATDEVQYCVTKLGCISTRYPWIEIHLHADGRGLADAHN